MSLTLRLSSCGHPQLWSNDQLLISKLEVDLPAILSDVFPEDVLEASPWEWHKGFSNGEACPILHRSLKTASKEWMTAQIECKDDVATFVVEMKQSVSGLRVGDSFELSSVAFPRMTLPDSYRCFLTTYGLGPSGDDGVGGYWPEAMVVESVAQLPSKAFAPLVLFDEANALAIAPANQFLTSALISERGDVVRSIHGSIDTLDSGTRIETMFAWGEDVTAALMRAGDSLLCHGNKPRPDPRDCLMTSKLGWWNAYGGYYTEPIHPLDGNALIKLLSSLREQGVPIGYIGLDLWYPYQFIGQALHFSPDTSKYIDGVGAISREFDLPTVLHLSALSVENQYQANGSDPAFYHKVAEELLRQHAVVAWHDWLRTQQHLTPKLRQDATAADAWFGGMAQAMADKGIRVMTCMHTMGMVLASTALPNVIAARSSIDYLFAQPEALGTLDRLGHGGFSNEATPLHIMRRQNLLVGFTYYALGLLPFYDLFLTQWHDAVGGLSPQAEAILRALSCGPIGIGDGPGMTDLRLVDALVSCTGDLLQPDHPPYPDPATLGMPVEVYRTEHTAGPERWDYILAINTTAQDQSFDMPCNRDDCFIWDGVHQSKVERMQGTIPSGEIAYYVLAPERDGIALLGLWNKIVPGPNRMIQTVTWLEGWDIQLQVPGESIAIRAGGPIVVTDQDGKELPQQHEGAFALCTLGEGVSSLHVARR